jgi:hypothetical protein
VVDQLEPGQLALQLQGNWKVLGPVASGQVKVAGLSVQAPTPQALAELPAVVRQAVADATPAGAELQVTKYVESVNGSVSTLVDDASVPSPTAVHLVVNTISLVGGVATATTHQVVAEHELHLPAPHPGPPAGTVQR